jgi:hypothetical protein
MTLLLHCLVCNLHTIFFSCVNKIKNMLRKLLFV